MRKVLVNQWKLLNYYLNKYTTYYLKRFEYQDGKSYLEYAPIILYIKNLYNYKVSDFTQEELQNLILVELSTFNKFYDKREFRHEFVIFAKHHKYNLNSILISHDLSNVEIQIYKCITHYNILQNVNCYILVLNDTINCLRFVDSLSHIKEVHITNNAEDTTIIKKNFEELICVVQCLKITGSYQIYKDEHDNTIKQLLEEYKDYIDNIKSGLSYYRYYLRII